MANQLLRGIAGLGLLLMGSAVFAAGPCPDGNYNPQNRVCMCPGGGYVGPGQWCEGGGGQVEIIPVPKTWGAIAIDMSSAQKRASFRHSEKSQEDANKRAIEGCGLSTCRVAVTFRNSCGAVAAGGNGIWGGGVDNNENRALQKAAAACYNKGAKDCKLWVSPKCVNAPR